MDNHKIKFWFNFFLFWKEIQFGNWFLTFTVTLRGFEKIFAIQKFIEMDIV